MQNSWGALQDQLKYHDLEKGKGYKLYEDYDLLSPSTISPLSKSLNYTPQYLEIALSLKERK